MRITRALEDVTRERERQREKGYDAAHDREHTPEVLARAGAAFADPRIAFFTVEQYFVWPWDKKYWKPRGLRDNLVRACALLLAAIERYDAGAEG